MVRWLRWHCPPDTGFEIRALEVWGRARYLSVTEAPHNTDFHTWMGKKHFLFLSNRRDREPNLSSTRKLKPREYYQIYSIPKSSSSTIIPTTAALLTIYSNKTVYFTHLFLTLCAVVFTMQGMSVIMPCEKIETFFIFLALWKKTLVQWLFIGRVLYFLISHSN